MTLVADGNVAAILSDFGADPQRAEGLAAYMGFEPIPNPEDRLAGALSGGLKQFLRGRGDGGYGVSELYRVGSRRADPAEVGLWVGVLSDWGYRSSDRDRSRRRITRALVEHVPDRRSLALLVPPPTDQRHEAELVFPRTQVGSSNGVRHQRSRPPRPKQSHPVPPRPLARAAHSLPERACWMFRGPGRSSSASSASPLRSTRSTPPSATA